MHVIEWGLEFYPTDPVLKQYKERLKRGEKLPLTSKAFQAIAGLHSALGPVLRLIEGGRSPKEAFFDVRDKVVSALHDANEAALGEPLLAA